MPLQTTVQLNHCKDPQQQEVIHPAAALFYMCVEQLIQSTEKHFWKMEQIITSEISTTLS